MMSTRALGLGPAFRKAVFAPRIVRNHVVLRNVAAKRSIQTTSLPPSASTEILNKQRLKRPSSPHFTIYQPQLTWLGSIANRVTGVALSVLLYGFSLAYLISPTNFSSEKMVGYVKMVPDYVKTAGKVVLAAPFAFHSFNGLRHLSWDLGYFLTLKGAYRSGYAVLGATALGTLGLVLM